MQVVGIRIRNILGIEDLEITPGRVTIIEGPNKAGKTSVIKALQSIVNGGHDATILRRDPKTGELAQEGSIAMVVEDDEGERYKIRKRVRPDKSDLTVESEEFGKMAKAKTWIDRLVDGLSFNPVQFLTAAPKNRVDALLAAVPARADPNAIMEVVGAWIKGAADLEGPALSVIGHVRELVFLRRRERNREATEKSAMSKQLREGLPSETGADGQDFAQEVKTLQNDLTSRRTTFRKELDGAAMKEDAVCQAADRAYDEALLAAAQLRDEAKNAAKAVADESQSKTRQAHEPEMNLLEKKITEVETMARTAEKAVGARDQVDRIEKEAATAAAQSEAMTGALGALDAMKADLLGEIPIEGLTIKDGEVYVGETPFDQMSTAERTSLAFEVAKLRAGKLGLVAIDGLEALDDEHLAAFEASALATKGIQLVYSQVVRGLTELGVRTRA